MDRVYSPWRSDYFGSKDDGKCIFCEISNVENLSTSQLESKDKKNRVFYRDEFVFGVMNAYPYTPGHFMLIPHRHCDSPELLDSSIWLHLHKLSHKAFALLSEYGASGVNMGLNIKKAGGAGIPEHLHLHFVPRYIGDTNFFTSIAECRTYGMDFDKVFDKIKALSQKHFC